MPHGKKFVTTENGDYLAVSEILTGKITLPSGAAVQVKRAFVNATTNTTTELIPAVTDATLRVLTLVMVHGTTAGTVTLKSASTAISPIFSNAANGGAVLPFNQHGWFQTQAMNEALNVTVSSSSDCGVIVQYIEIPDGAYDLL
jgi:hypothetical protein